MTNQDSKKMMSKSLAALGHGKPKSRRDFLAYGLKAGAASALVPTSWGLLRSSLAMAQNRTPMPFLIFDLAGGAAMPGNFLVGRNNPAGNPEDALLSSYSMLGWDARGTNAYDASLGLPMANVSQMRNGINQRASAEARAKLRLGSFCHFAQDDSQTNPLSPYFFLLESGYRGELSQVGLGTQNSATGGNSTATAPDASRRPALAQTVSGLLQNFAPAGALVGIEKTKLERMYSRLARLSAEQLQRFDSTPDGAAFRQLLQQASQQNSRVIGLDVQGALDARRNSICQAVYGINANTGDDSMDAVFASIILAVVQGASGPGVLTIGGCDYHDGTQNTGDNKDLEIGRHIGSAVEIAHRLQKPLFFQVLTDGGVASDVGRRSWRNDAGDKGMTVIGYYNPSAAPTQRRIQVGGYLDEQGADRSTLIGARPDKVSCAVFANYLNVQGLLDDPQYGFGTVIPQGLMTRREVDETLIFG